MYGLLSSQVPGSSEPLGEGGRGVLGAVGGGEGVEERPAPGTALMEAIEMTTSGMDGYRRPRGEGMHLVCGG